MINNSLWQTILQTATDFTTVVEIYSADSVPDVSNGFEPGDALAWYAPITGYTYSSYPYTKAVQSISGIKRTITGEINGASVTFSNIDGRIARFESTYGFEGLIMVIRLISRSLSTSIGKTQTLFAGRCEKPTEGDKESLTVKASWILASKNVVIPRRKYTKEDQEGRVNTDPEFEGFEFIPQEGTSSYQVRVKRGGIAGFFGKKKWVTRTMAWSSFSDLDATKSIPEVFGISQLIGTHIGYADTGGFILIRDALCEGEISGFENARSLDPNLPLEVTDYLELTGETGAANYDSGGVAPGNYSRTACIRGKASNSAVDVNESAPDIAVIIVGRLLTVPDGSGNWVTTLTWTNNAAAIARYIITSDDYFKLNSGWIDDADAYTCWQYNASSIIKRSLSDFTFLKAG